MPENNIEYVTVDKYQSIVFLSLDIEYEYNSTKKAIYPFLF